MTTRYDARGTEAEFEPGSRGKVLCNLLGITRARDMELAESQALWLAQQQAIETFPRNCCLIYFPARPPRLPPFPGKRLQAGSAKRRILTGI